MGRIVLGQEARSAAGAERAALEGQLLADFDEIRGVRARIDRELMRLDTLCDRMERSFRALDDVRRREQADAERKLRAASVPAMGAV